MFMINFGSSRDGKLHRKCRLIINLPYIMSKYVFISIYYIVIICSYRININLFKHSYNNHVIINYSICSHLSISPLKNPFYKPRAFLERTLRHSSYSLSFFTGKPGNHFALICLECYGDHIIVLCNKIHVSGYRSVFSN